MSDVILSAIIGVIGVILGSIITIFGGIWQSTLQFRRERLHKIDGIKKDLYSHAIDLLMKQDACIRKNLSKEECDAVLEEFNNLQSKMMLYASSDIRRSYYKLNNEIVISYENKNNKKEREKIKNKNADKIMSFTDKLRKELGIKN